MGKKSFLALFSVKLYVAMHVFSTRVFCLSSFYWQSEMNFSAAIFIVTAVCIEVCFGEENKTVQKDSSEEAKEEGPKYVHVTPEFPIQIVFRLFKPKISDGGQGEVLPVAPLLLRLDSGN